LYNAPTHQQLLRVLVVLELVAATAVRAPHQEILEQFIPFTDPKSWLVSCDS
jgi:hypothetical protein